MEIFVHDTNDNPIREATIILGSIEVLGCKDKRIFTYQKGHAISQINPGTYGILI